VLKNPVESCQQVIAQTPTGDFQAEFEKSCCGDKATTLSAGAADPGEE